MIARILEEACVRELRSAIMFSAVFDRFTHLQVNDGGCSTHTDLNLPNQALACISLSP